MGAASIFGTLVSQINEIVASQTTISKELDKVLEAYFSIQPRRVASCLIRFDVMRLICASSCLTLHINFGFVPKHFVIPDEL